MTKRLIGYATTNSDGVATFTYVGKGVGEVDIIAESKGAMLFFDDGSGSNTEWTVINGTGSKSSTANGTKLSNNNSTRYDIFIQQTGQSSTYYFNAPFVIEVDITEISGSPRLQIYSSTTNEVVNAISSVGHWIISYNGTTVTIQKDNYTLTTYTRNMPNARVGFFVGQNEYITYQNLFIFDKITGLTSEPYPIEDCYFVESGSSTSLYTVGSGASLSLSNGEFTLTKTASSNVYMYLNIPKTSLPIADFVGKHLIVKTDIETSVTVNLSLSYNDGSWSTAVIQSISENGLLTNEFDVSSNATQIRIRFDIFGDVGSIVKLKDFRFFVR